MFESRIPVTPRARQISPNGLQGHGTIAPTQVAIGLAPQAVAKDITGVRSRLPVPSHRVAPAIVTPNVVGTVVSTSTSSLSVRLQNCLASSSSSPPPCTVSGKSRLPISIKSNSPDTLAPSYQSPKYSPTVASPGTRMNGLAKSQMVAKRILDSNLSNSTAATVVTPSDHHVPRAQATVGPSQVPEIEHVKRQSQGKATTFPVEGKKESLKSTIRTTVISNVYIHKEVSNHNPYAKKDSTAKGDIVPVPSKLNKPTCWAMRSPENNIRTNGQKGIITAQEQTKNITPLPHHSTGMKTKKPALVLSPKPMAAPKAVAKERRFNSILSSPLTGLSTATEWIRIWDEMFSGYVGNGHKHQ